MRPPVLRPRELPASPWSGRSRCSSCVPCTERARRASTPRPFQVVFPVVAIAAPLDRAVSAVSRTGLAY